MSSLTPKISDDLFLGIDQIRSRHRYGGPKSKIFHKFTMLSLVITLYSPEGEPNTIANFDGICPPWIRHCAQGLYMATRAGYEPTTLRLKGIDSTSAPPRPTKFPILGCNLLLHEIEINHKLKKVACNLDYVRRFHSDVATLLMPIDFKSQLIITMMAHLHVLIEILFRFCLVLMLRNVKVLL